MKSYCKKCLDSMYCQALSTGKCKICGKPTPTPHLPSYELCDNCAEPNNLCIQCGIELNEN